MTPFIFAIHLGLILFLLNSISATAQEIQNLTLKAAVLASLKNNLDIKIDQLNVAEKQAQWTQKEGDFDINWSFSFTEDNSQVPSSTSLDDVGTSALETNTTSYSNRLSKLFSWGSTLEIPYSYSVTESNAGTRLFDQNHSPSLALKITQPLIRSFDFDYHVSQQIQARLAWMAEAELQKDKSAKTIFDTIDLYSKTLEAQELVKIKNQSYEIAKQTLDLVERKLQIGRASKIDQLEALAKKLQSYEGLLSAQFEANSKMQELSLKVFVKLKPSFKIKFYQNLIPNFQQQDLSKLVQAALTQRPETKKDQFLLKKASLDYEKSDTDLWPKVNLSYEVSYNGLAGTSSDAHDQITDQSFQSTSLSADIQYPLIGYAAHASKRIKKVKLDQQKLRSAKNIQNLKLDIENNWNKLNNSHLRLQALKTVQAAELQKFDAQSQKHKLGKTSTFDLLTALNDKEQAQLDFLKSKMSYLRAHYNLARVTGQLLSKF